MAPQQLQQLIQNATTYPVYNPGRGRGVAAAHDVEPKSQIMFIARPLVIALESAKLPVNCYTCFKAPSESGLTSASTETRPLKTCSGCKVVKFCDQTCQAQAWSQYHRLECKLFARLHPRVLPSTVRATIRVLKQHKAGMLPDGEWDQLLALENHRDDLAAQGGERWENLVIMAQGVKSYSGTDQSLDVVIRLLCILMVNSFTLTNPTFDAIGMVLHPKPAFMNHSCRPNAFIRCDVAPSSGQPELPFYGSLSVHAYRRIRKDEEITICYVDNSHPFEKRRRELKERYFFSCVCDRCEREQNSRKDRFDLAFNLPALPDGPPSVDPITFRKADDAEQLLLLVEAEGGGRPEHIGQIRQAMTNLASTGVWPLHLYPYVQLRGHLLFGLLQSKAYPEAFWQAGILERLTHPALYEQPYHPSRLVQMWLFWNLCRVCLESSAFNVGGSRAALPQIRMVGWLHCITIDDLQRLLLTSDARVDGQLERLVETAFRNVQSENGLWNEYQRNPSPPRRGAWSAMDGQIKDTLRREGVSEVVINSAFSRVPPRQ